MSEPDPIHPASVPSAFGSRFARLSTSAKMLIILTLALLPLGVIASLASIETARANRASRELAAHLLASDSAARLTRHLDRAVASLRDASSSGGAGCRRAVADIGGDERAVRVAMFGNDGRLVCANRSLSSTLPLRAVQSRPLVALDPESDAVRVIASTDRGWALAVFPRAALAAAAHPDAVDGSYDLRLVDANGGAVPLATMRSVVIGRSVATRLPVSGGQIQLVLTVEAPPLSANETLLILLPLLMWVAAAAVGWLVVDRLILRPLGDLQTAIELSRSRGGPLVLPPITTPAQEIRDLAGALSGANATIARHEAELEDGLARQTKLTREVHHRVKNNLQVVASLLNIHARGAATPEAVAAYGAIQRRVEALALVHRSHYAELEVNRGLALKPLLGELVANLRASAPAGRAPATSVDAALLCATQDVAVPVAFLITELFEMAMLRGAGTRIAIRLERGEAAGRARLSILSPALAQDAAPADEGYVRGLRVVEGLARQLRGNLATDPENGGFAVEIIVMDDETCVAPDTRDAAMQRRGGTLVPSHITGRA